MSDPVHIRPEGDLLAHTWEDCACLPFVEYQQLENGTTERLYIHNAWDGRE